MTEEPNQETVQEDLSEKAPDAITAFIVIKVPDGSYVAISDLTKTFTVARSATITDIRQGCEELRYTITKSDIISGVIDALKATNTQNSETKDA
jgi:hypothetical protein